jgi:hypothetical protein
MKALRVIKYGELQKVGFNQEKIELLEKQHKKVLETGKVEEWEETCAAVLENTNPERLEAAAAIEKYHEKAQNKWTEEFSKRLIYFMPNIHKTGEIDIIDFTTPIPNTRQNNTAIKNQIKSLELIIKELSKDIQLMKLTMEFNEVKKRVDGINIDKGMAGYRDAARLEYTIAEKRILETRDKEYTKMLNRKQQIQIESEERIKSKQLRASSKKSKYLNGRSVEVERRHTDTKIADIEGKYEQIGSAIEKVLEQLQKNEDYTIAQLNDISIQRNIKSGDRLKCASDLVIISGRFMNLQAAAVDPDNLVIDPKTTEYSFIANDLVNNIDSGITRIGMYITWIAELNEQLLQPKKEKGETNLNKQLTNIEKTL